MSEYVTQKIAPEFQKYGVELTQVLIENISLPNEVEEALDKRTSMGMIGNLDKYLQFQAAESLGSGNGNSGMDMGMGFAMANKMADSLNTGSSAQDAGAVPPPLPHNSWHVADGDNSTGPHSLAEVMAMIQSGKVNAATLVWQTGMDNWQAAAEVSTFSQLVAAQTPPPLPKS